MWQIFDTNTYQNKGDRMVNTEHYKADEEFRKKKVVTDSFAKTMMLGILPKNFKSQKSKPDIDTVSPLSKNNVFMKLINLIYKKMTFC